MSKAEKFISEHVRNCSNEIIVSTRDGNSYTKGYTPWLTPDQARRAVEIAREEMIEKALISFQVVCNRQAKLLPNCENHCTACKQFKQTLKDE